jgi:hypothetical protein
MIVKAKANYYEITISKEAYTHSFDGNLNDVFTLSEGGYFVLKPIDKISMHTDETGVSIISKTEPKIII